MGQHCPHDQRRTRHLPRPCAVDRAPHRRPARPHDAGREARPAGVRVVDTARAARSRRRHGLLRRRRHRAHVVRHRAGHADRRVDRPAADRARRAAQPDPAVPDRADTTRHPRGDPRGGRRRVLRPRRHAVPAGDRAGRHVGHAAAVRRRGADPRRDARRRRTALPVTGARHRPGPPVGPRRGDLRRGPGARRRAGHGVRAWVAERPRRVGRRPSSPASRRHRHRQALPRVRAVRRWPQPRAGPRRVPRAARGVRRAVRGGDPRRRHGLGDEQLRVGGRPGTCGLAGAAHRAAARRARLPWDRRRGLLRGRPAAHPSPCRADQGGGGGTCAARRPGPGAAVDGLLRAAATAGRGRGRARGGRRPLGPAGAAPQVRAGPVRGALRRCRGRVRGVRHP